MPVIKSAIKKLRKDIKRTKANDDVRRKLDLALRNAKKVKSAKAVSAAVSLVDHAVKKNLMHKNRAARIKSSLSKLAKPQARTSAKPAAKSTAKPASKTPKASKTPAKKAS